MSGAETSATASSSGRRPDGVGGQVINDFSDSWGSTLAVAGLVLALMILVLVFS
jgi:hypothetical protein